MSLHLAVFYGCLCSLKKKKKWDCGRCSVEAEPYFTYVAPGIVVKVYCFFTFEPKRSNHCLLRPNYHSSHTSLLLREKDMLSSTDSFFQVALIPLEKVGVKIVKKIFSSVE